ncbi:hypothetical protein AKJ16_DCAP16412 [Drosera capensis]
MRLEEDRVESSFISKDAYRDINQESSSPHHCHWHCPTAVLLFLNTPWFWSDYRSHSSCPIASLPRHR